MTQTPLDDAHARMEATDGEADRLRFYDRLAAAELFLLLETEAEDDRITPRIFPVEGQNFVLVFDTEARLADLAGASPYAVMTGRKLVQLLVGQDLGIGLNLGVAPSSFLMGADAVSWMAETAAQRPETVEVKPKDLSPPGRLPEHLLESLDARMAASAGLAEAAYLCEATFESGARGHLLAFIDPAPGAEDALAALVAEALSFSGVEAGTIDVAFFAGTDAVAAKLATVGLRFDLPKPEATAPRPAPGSDPDRPPKLR